MVRILKPIMLLLALLSALPASAGISAPFVRSDIYLPSPGCSPGPGCRSSQLQGAAEISDSGTNGAMFASTSADLASQSLAVTAGGGGAANKAVAAAGFAEEYFLPVLTAPTDVDWSFAVDGSVTGSNGGTPFGSFLFEIFPSNALGGPPSGTGTVQISVLLDELFDGTLATDGSYTQSGTLTVFPETTFLAIASNLSLSSEGADINFGNTAGYRVEFEAAIAPLVARASGLPLQPVPLPGALWLLGPGLLALAGFRTRTN